MKLAFAILAGAPGHRIGIMSRVKSRLRFIDEHLESLGADFHRWEDGLMDTDTAKIVRATLERLDIVEWAARQTRWSSFVIERGWSRSTSPTLAERWRTL